MIEGWIFAKHLLCKELLTTMEKQRYSVIFD